MNNTQNDAIDQEGHDMSHWESHTVYAGDDSSYMAGSAHVPILERFASSNATKMKLVSLRSGVNITYQAPKLQRPV
jgi:hypothetical protein